MSRGNGAPLLMAMLFIVVIFIFLSWLGDSAGGWDIDPAAISTYAPPAPMAIKPPSIIVPPPVAADELPATSTPVPVVPTLTPTPPATECRHFYPSTLQMYVDCLLSPMPTGCRAIVQVGWVGGPPLYYGGEIATMLGVTAPYIAALPDGQLGTQASPHSSIVYTNCRPVQLKLIELGIKSAQQGGAIDG